MGKLIAWVVVSPLVLFGVAIGAVPIIFNFRWQPALIACVGGALICFLALTSIREALVERDDPARSPSAGGGVPPFE